MIFSLFILHFFAPLFVLFQLGMQQFSSRMEWLAALILATGVTVVLSMIGHWGWFSIYLVPIYCLLLVIAIWRSARRYSSIELHSPAKGSAWLEFTISMLLGALAWGGAVMAWGGHTYPERVVDLSFPFHEGTYLVGHGGSSSIVNHHYGHKSQKYALDILRLYPWGGRAKGVYPDMITAYATYHTPIYSPCAGSVAAVINNLPDQPPGHFDRDNPAGNYVAVECGGIVVYLAHFSTGSIIVNVGDFVDADTELGLSGNSGNTSEPHLHIHAEEGKYPGVFSGSPAVAMTFGQRFLVRNSVVFQ
ncbi:MAG: M23 family metallopeptidase [Pseudomonadota bacterium]